MRLKSSSDFEGEMLTEMPKFEDKVIQKQIEAGKVRTPYTTDYPVVCKMGIKI